ncbi:hypothetical protein KIW84_044713 [Lathyrus oleraceus]|uniref:Protein kinase domain-containing protein n=1 Tax=Pisum sativum TaxID=3888 RepID=A0A9D5AQR0_PEA|nr:hypothetical protein KIW84_044713 [Pisum sativum]
MQTNHGFKKSTKFSPFSFVLQTGPLRCESPAPTNFYASSIAGGCRKPSMAEGFVVSEADRELEVIDPWDSVSLDRWLHKKNKTSVAFSTVHHDIIDWPKRLHTTIRAAQVVDFGLARILIKPEELATMPAVAGAFGYIGPEYAQTIRVNEKIDVYSFGVVLLELTTGNETNLKTASR